MELEKLKSKRSSNKSVITKFSTNIEGARNSEDFDKASVITNFEKILKKQTFLEELCEQILKETNLEDVADEVWSQKNIPHC